MTDPTAKRKKRARKTAKSDVHSDLVQCVSRFPESAIEKIAKEGPIGAGFWVSRLVDAAKRVCSLYYEDRAAGEKKAKKKRFRKKVMAALAIRSYTPKGDAT